MNARKCVHAQKPYPCQAFAHESRIQGRSEEEENERKRDRKDRGQEGDRKEWQTNTTKHILGTKTRPT